MGYTDGDTGQSPDDIWARNLTMPPHVGKRWIDFFKKSLAEQKALKRAGF